ncbi:DNA gyrase inhibitor YacG [Sphingomonas sp. LaA6.9]|nr:DNA gyrase inhibitor YacG [Sphingomonas sp. LaA6.9]MCJ8158305.1 DNA gyrase inhibitor YacG [Sphingomonas sp. LaA6.9]
MSAANTPKSRRGQCPLCGKPAQAEHTPFCSRGCRDRDLLQWLGDGYRIPGPAADSTFHENDQNGLDREG